MTSVHTTSIYMTTVHTSRVHIKLKPGTQREAETGRPTERQRPQQKQGVLG